MKDARLLQYPQVQPAVILKMYSPLECIHNTCIYCIYTYTQKYMVGHTEQRHTKQGTHIKPDSINGVILLCSPAEQDRGPLIKREIYLYLSICIIYIYIHISVSLSISRSSITYISVSTIWVSPASGLRCSVCPLSALDSSLPSYCHLDIQPSEYAALLQ